jgi:hypothetical protein
LGEEYFDEAKRLWIHGRLIVDRPLRNEDLVYVRPLSTLEHFGVTEVKLDDGALMHLAGSAGLRSLNLCATSITDAGLVHLRNLHSLRKLDISCTQVSNEGLRHLDMLTQLEWLDVQATSVSTAGIVELNRALPHCMIWRF